MNDIAYTAVMVTVVIVFCAYTAVLIAGIWNNEDYIAKWSAKIF